MKFRNLGTFGYFPCWYQKHGCFQLFWREFSVANKGSTSLKMHQRIIVELWRHCQTMTSCRYEPYAEKRTKTKAIVSLGKITLNCLTYLTQKNKEDRDFHFLTRLINSERVLAFSRNSPSMVEVTVVAPSFCTPRIVIHMCLKEWYWRVNSTSEIF